MKDITAVTAGILTSLMFARSAIAQDPSEVGMIPYPNFHPSNQTGINNPALNDAAMVIGVASLVAAVGFVAYFERKEIATHLNNFIEKTKVCCAGLSGMFSGMFRRKNPEAQPVNPNDPSSDYSAVGSKV